MYSAQQSAASTPHQTIRLLAVFGWSLENSYSKNEVSRQHIGMFCNHPGYFQYNYLMVAYLSHTDFGTLYCALSDSLLVAFIYNRYNLLIHLCPSLSPTTINGIMFSHKYTFVTSVPILRQFELADLQFQIKIIPYESKSLINLYHFHHNYLS